MLWHLLQFQYLQKVFLFGYTVTVIKVVYLLGCEITQMITLDKKLNYVNFDNAMDWADLIPTIVYLVTIWTDPLMAFNAGTWIILFGFLNLTLSAGEFPLFGTIIQAIFSVAVTLLSVMFVIAPILIGFMIFFYFTAKNTGSIFQNDDIALSALKVLAMMLGNIHIKEFNTGKPHFNVGSNTTDWPITSTGSVQSGILFFMIFICIVIMNVLIGLTVNRIDHFVEKGVSYCLSKMFFYILR